MIMMSAPSSPSSSSIQMTHAPPHSPLQECRSSTSTTIDPTKLVAKPKRALNAYNIFYKLERPRVLDGSDVEERQIHLADLHRIRREHQINPKRAHRKTMNGGTKISFQELNRIIAKRWKSLPADIKSIFEEQATLDKQEVDRKLQEWKAQEEASSSLSSRSAVSHFVMVDQQKKLRQQQQQQREQQQAAMLQQEQPLPEPALSHRSSASSSLDHHQPVMLPTAEPTFSSSSSSSLDHVRQQVDHRLATLFDPPRRVSSMTATTTSSANSSCCSTCVDPFEPLDPFGDMESFQPLDPREMEVLFE
eukprot:CAMPEP_0172454294 /NCGR_PEP_ID=MMETSP1065-20121228/11329_1 /TAXON_ID=265537 /ORGANISM="Amphiprora paludosa, Strain CCMP125" /LENGTH=304 /DNA_ID=CAMNT_0013206603 /DNA_START=94 /DNA_END=1011 /DNA_ORIENTATION=-